MNHSHRGVWVIIAIIVIVLIGIIAVYSSGGSSSTPAATSTSTATTQNIQAVFTCDAGKSINAVFMNSTTSTTTGNSVQISLSDGRQMNLPQVVSADGAKYASADQSDVFWNVGNQATFWENGTSTYTNCATQNQ